MGLLARVASETTRRQSGANSQIVLAAAAIITVFAIAGLVAVWPDGRTSTSGPRREAGRSEAVLSTASTPAPPRPETGTILAGEVGPEHYGILRVINGSGKDSLVKLVAGTRREAALVFFVRAGDTGVVEGVPDGSYSLRFATGDRWNPSVSRFADGVQFEFDGAFGFETERTADGVRYSENEVTLHEVLNGNVRAKRIAASEF